MHSTKTWQLKNLLKFASNLEKLNVANCLGSNDVNLFIKSAIKITKKRTNNLILELFINHFDVQNIKNTSQYLIIDLLDDDEISDDDDEISDDNVDIRCDDRADSQDSDNDDEKPEGTVSLNLSVTISYF